MKHPVSRARRGAAFTLVELLAVIAITGILAAIIIPVTGRVREAARISRCGSNVRQSALAMLLYAGENNGCLPPAITQVNGGDKYCFAGLLVERGYIARQSQVFTCPGDPSIARIRDAGYTPRSYALLSPLQGMTRGNYPTVNHVPVSLTVLSAAHPLSRTGMVSEWIQPDTTDMNMITVEGPWGSIYGNNLIANSADARGSTGHREGCRNVAFCDGHVKFMSPPEMLVNNNEIWKKPDQR
ncbi:MAG: DUF1559 domain-containing protein [Opitutaceae bacterium]|jgi:prepilin-type processing-associated H-X9-DG protein/prepilin-type N-terminal cleavage/methylation domain-containing protein|nr:DUF1559 domain-containing protein [Opitutaceae bacterium]